MRTEKRLEVCNFKARVVFVLLRLRSLRYSQPLSRARERARALSCTWINVT
jgi:hypothetical protein